MGEITKGRPLDAYGLGYAVSCQAVHVGLAVALSAATSQGVFYAVIVAQVARNDKFLRLLMARSGSCRQRRPVIYWFRRVSNEWELSAEDS